MADAKSIEPEPFISELREASLPAFEEAKNELSQRMIEGGATFWEVIHEPFLGRELSRSQVRDVISQGLLRARGSYRRMSVLFNVQPDQYQKFMDFLRHHRLKPDDS
jgi:hypothetical protein